MKNASDYIIKLDNGKLAATELPDEQGLLSEVMAILTADYKGETTYGAFRLPEWSVNYERSGEEY